MNTEKVVEHIVNWLKDYQTFLPKYLKWFPFIFGAISITLIILGILKITPISSNDLDE